jgi:hypothetical protein
MSFQAKGRIINGIRYASMGFCDSVSFRKLVLFKKKKSLIVGTHSWHLKYQMLVLFHS